MAKYSITYSCGHEGTIQLTGKHSERERYVEWASANKLCPECYQAKLAAERETANKIAAEANASCGLPPLVGSEKQITWAESIRKPVLETLLGVERAVKKHRPEGMDQAVIDERNDAVALLMSEVIGQSEARWWIDHREDVVRELQDSGRARLWLTAQIRARNLAPRFSAYADQIRANKEAAAKAEQDRKEQEAAARHAAQEREREAVRAEAQSVEREADTFKVVSVRCAGTEGAAIDLDASDGRKARGAIMDGAWAVYEVNGRTIDSMTAAAERLAKAAGKLWQQGQATAPAEASHG